MGNEMIERVARVVDPEAWSEESIDITCLCSGKEVHYQRVRLHGHSRASSLLIARSAIEAMREPTGPMNEAAWMGDLDSYARDENWRSMIDAILTESVS